MGRRSFYEVECCYSPQVSRLCFFILSLSISPACQKDNPQSPQTSAKALPIQADSANPWNLSLRILTEPSGAQIWINSKPIGKTPSLIKGLRREKYLIELELDGYEKETRNIIPTEDMTIYLDLKSLSPSQKTSPVNIESQRAATTSVVVPTKFRIESDPSGAEVWMHGAKVGRTPLNVVGAKEGTEYPIELKLEGYKSVKQRFVFKEKTTLLFVLTKPTGEETN